MFSVGVIWRETFIYTITPAFKKEMSCSPVYNFYRHYRVFIKVELIFNLLCQIFLIFFSVQTKTLNQLRNFIQDDKKNFEIDFMLVCSMTGILFVIT